MACVVHDQLISAGFREDRAGRYTKGQYRVTYRDHGPNRYQRHAPDSNRYTMRLYRDGALISSGTAWYAILARIPTNEVTP